MDIETADKIKWRAITEGKLKEAPLMKKWYMTRSTSGGPRVMHINYYHGQGDYDFKYQEGTELKKWKDATTAAIFKAKKSGDPIDQAEADILAWPIINLNWSKKYTEAERREIYKVFTGDTYQVLNIYRKAIKNSPERAPPVMYSLFHEEFTKQDLAIPKKLATHAYRRAFDTPDQSYEQQQVEHWWKKEDFIDRTKTQKGKRINGAWPYEYTQYY